jgi:hypothetical protein
VELLQRLHEGQQATVQTDQRSNPFPIQRGTKQGDPISPILFNAVVELFMARLKKTWGAKKYGMKVDSFADKDHVTNLKYADDILLIATSLPQIKWMLGDVAKEAARVGLQLHPDKTKILRNNIGCGSRVREAKCGDVLIEVLDCNSQAQYLGRTSRMTTMDDEEIMSRISEAWAKYGVCKGELNDSHVPLKLRIKLFNAVITPSSTAVRLAQ